MNRIVDSKAAVIASCIATAQRARPVAALHSFHCKNSRIRLSRTADDVAAIVKREPELIDPTIEFSAWCVAADKKAPSGRSAAEVEPIAHTMAVKAAAVWV
jgi:hypothetical protein